MNRLRLSIVPHGAGAVEWRLQAPALTPQKLASVLLIALAGVATPAAWLGVSWRHALLLGAAAAAVLCLVWTQLAVQQESLTYLRLLGVRLATRRRCGLWGSDRYLPLRQLQGLVIHEEVTATSVYFYIALALKPETQEQRNGGGGGGSSTRLGLRRSSSSSGGGFAGFGGSSGASRVLTAGEGGGEVAVVFPSLRPRPDLSQLKQVYQQLQPLLQADLEKMAAAAVPARSSSGGGGDAAQQQGQGQQERGEHGLKPGAKGAAAAATARNADLAADLAAVAPAEPPVQDVKRTGLAGKQQ